MNINDYDWDEITAGNTGNLLIEVGIMDKVKEEIKAGKEVFLTDSDGNCIYKLGYNLDTETFSKIFLNI